MTQPEIAFLALGLVLGAAAGAALVQAVRTGSAPRRNVRVTVAPNAIPVRGVSTLAVAGGVLAEWPVPDTFDDSAWPGYRQTAPLPLIAPARPASEGHLNRTSVLCDAPSIPAAAVAIAIEAGVFRSPAVAIPVEESASRAGVALGERPWAGASATAALTAAGTAAVPGASLDHAAAVPAGASPGEGSSRPTTASRGAGPASDGGGPVSMGAAPADGGSTGPNPVSHGGGPVSMGPAPADGGSTGASSGAGGAGPAADGTPGAECADERRLVSERCAVAEAAREEARRAHDALRESQRAYDSLRERVEHAQEVCDPRQVALAKERLHAAFRTTGAGSPSAEEAEAAARAWLADINSLNSAVREAKRLAEAGDAELRTMLPALERRSLEADAARISAENAQAGCHAAREDLARCEEQVEALAAAAAVPPAPEEPHPFAHVWPTQEPDLVTDDSSRESPLVGLSAIVRVLNGDRDARDRIVATVAGADPDAERDWQLRLAHLVDAIVARAIEDGFLDLPEDDPFWRMFGVRETREIVVALAALGFRFDGLGGFADERVPGARDLSLAVGYAGLDPMRIRAWPRDAELTGLYARATVAADEWLASAAGDLSLGRMVDALGARAADLADVWNAWGRLRPALLAT